MYKLTTFKAYHVWKNNTEVVARFSSLEEAKKCLPHVVQSKIAVFENIEEYKKLRYVSGEKLLKILDSLPEYPHDKEIFATKLFKGRSHILENAAIFTNKEEAEKFTLNGELGTVHKIDLKDYIYNKYYDYKVQEPDFNL